LRNFGINGYGWSNTGVTYSSATSANAYNLNFNASGVNPSNGPNNRWNGFPVRFILSRFGADLYFLPIFCLRAKDLSGLAQAVQVQLYNNISNDINILG